jgi:hypothetical protein
MDIAPHPAGSQSVLTAFSWQKIEKDNCVKQHQQAPNRLVETCEWNENKMSVCRLAKTCKWNKNKMSVCNQKG